MSDNLIGATTAIFIVSLSIAVTEPVDVAWSTRDGTAKAGTDYQAANGVVSFLPGETTKQIEVIVYGQNVSPTGDKNFFINLMPPTNAVLGTTLIEAVIKVEDESGVPVTSVIVAQGKRGLKGDPGLSAYEQAVLMGYDGTLEDWMQEQADAAAAAQRASDYAANAAAAATKAENAATAASFLGNIFPTPEAGVDPVTGVGNGAYYNVRSTEDDSYLVEYQNIGGIPTPSGKSYPSASAVNQIAGDVNTLSEAIIDPDTGEATTAKIIDPAFSIDQKAVNDIALYKVDTVIELKSIKPRAQGMRVSIRSYGDGELYWDSLSTETANDIDIFQSDRAAVGRWKWVEFKSVAQGGVISDGVTDQTIRINQITARMGAIGLRRQISIPPNTKYDQRSVLQNLPVGINLQFFDTTNWGQPPGYKTRVIGSFSSGSLTDDTAFTVGDTHHPAIVMLNLGTAGSSSSNGRAASLIHAVGITSRGDHLNAQILQFNTSDTDKWQTTIRTLIPHAIALKDPVGWVSGKTYAAGDMCLSDGNKVYVTTSGGTSGDTAPTGTGTGINDGGVVWDYYAARRSRDGTTFSIDEDGNMSTQGSSMFSPKTSYVIRTDKNRLMLEVDNTNGNLLIRDYNRNGRTILGSEDAKGIYNDGVNSVRFSNLSGATPTLAVTGGRVINAAPTNMTGLNLPAGQTSGMCYLHFADANTTLKHGAFQLKDGVDVTPPANGFMVFIRNISVGNSWFEVSRSF